MRDLKGEREKENESFLCVRKGKDRESCEPEEGKVWFKTKLF